MMKLIVAFVVILLVAQSSANSCKYGDYDFTALSNGTTYNVLSNGFNYHWAYCAAAKNCGADNTVTACQVKISTGTLNPTPIGTLSTQKFQTINNGVDLIYNASATSPTCKNGLVRSMMIHMTCGTTDMSFSTVTEPVSCQYEVDVVTCHACKGGCDGKGPSGDGAKKGGMGGGWIFIIILVVCSVVYVAGGAIFNFKVKGLRGAETIPNAAFWKDLPGLMKDGVFFIKSKISGTPSGSYQQV
eukprot:gene11627-13575_t